MQIGTFDYGQFCDEKSGVWTPLVRWVLLMNDSSKMQNKLPTNHQCEFFLQKELIAVNVIM